MLTYIGVLQGLMALPGIFCVGDGTSTGCLQQSKLKLNNEKYVEFNF